MKKETKTTRLYLRVSPQEKKKIDDLAKSCGVSTAEYVDEGRIAFTPAVELSYLTEEEQYELLEEIELNDCTPSLSQACRLKRMSRDGSLTSWDIAEIMSEEKANQKERLRIPMERVSRYFPSSFTLNQIEDEIVKLCESNYRRRMSRDER